MIQLQLLNPDPDWPGYPKRPDGDGWIWVKDEVDIINRLPNYPTLEIVSTSNDRYNSLHKILAFYGPHPSLLGIGGYESCGVGHVYALGKRGGAWIRRVETPTWALLL